MTENTMEQTPPMATPAKTGSRDNVDRYLITGGLAIAAFAAFFPWYVFLNQEKFGVRPMGYESSRDLSELPGRSIVGVSPLAIPDADTDSTSDSLDVITTATVLPESEPEPEELAGADSVQAFPGANPRFRLLHVVNGRALIEDDNGVYLVRVGSVLPDDSRLATMEERDDGWTIITSDGNAISQ